MKKTQLERFEALTLVARNGCWLWLGSVHKRRGYGKFSYAAGEWGLAHRWAWRLFRGPIPEGMCVLHKCDMPPCVNPEHLWLGTKADNNADMHRKGRANYYGETAPRSGNRWVSKPLEVR